MIRRTWPIPIAIACITVAGLIAALTGEGARNALSWVALGVPVAAVVWAMRTRRT